MNQDECFEEMTQHLSGFHPSLGISTGMINSGSGRNGASEENAARSLISGIMSVNFISCSIIQLGTLAVSRTWLHRLESNLERHGDQFLFKASYRVHCSLRHRWNSSNDTIYTLENNINEYYRGARGVTADERATTRKYRKTVSKIYSDLAGRSNYSDYPIDGQVITVLIGGKIPKRQMFEDGRAFLVSYSTIEDCHRLIGWNNLTGSRFDSSRLVLDAQFADNGLSHGESFPAYGRLAMYDRATDPNVVGAITDIDRRLLNKQTYYSDESLYTGYIPEANNLKEVLVPDENGWSLYLHEGEPPTPIQGKNLSDWLIDTKLHVSATIELYRLSDGRSIRLEPGVYQLLYHDEEKRLTESLFVYTDNVRNLVHSDYRAMFPSGKLQAITVADDCSVVEVSHINVKDLTLPSEDESVTTFFQRSKNI